jgi:hypothetical protein
MRKLRNTQSSSWDLTSPRAAEPGRARKLKNPGKNADRVQGVLQTGLAEKKLIFAQ